MSNSVRRDYGIDAPIVQRRFLILGLIGIIAGLFFFSVDWSPKFLPRPLAVSLGMTLLSPGISCLASAGVMFWGSKAGKLRLARKLIDHLQLRGDERVLDVGCGHGLLLITAAKCLPAGKAVGVDLWQSEDQAGNDPEATLANARLEKVADRVQLKTGDARELPFADNAFEAVTSSWALHNIYDRPGRDKAVREIARVLKPSGRVAIIDIRHTHDYAAIFRGLGFDVKLHGPNFIFVLPSW
jgi:SAM-dependent methyltransferase